MLNVKHTILHHIILIDNTCITLSLRSKCTVQYLIGVNQSVVIAQAWFLAANFILDEEEVNLSPFINLWATSMQLNLIDGAILANCLLFKIWPMCVNPTPQCFNISNIKLVGLVLWTNVVNWSLWREHKRMIGIFTCCSFYQSVSVAR